MGSEAGIPPGGERIVTAVTAFLLLTVFGLMVWLKLNACSSKRKKKNAL
jgi:hypothetical protein